MKRPTAERVDVKLLALEKATLSETYPILAMHRLTPSLADTQGEARASFRFYRVVDRSALDGEVEAQVSLICQRCMTPMTLGLEARLELVFVESESRITADLPEGLEPALAPEGRVSLAELVEDELLLALPLVARHSNVADCERAGLNPELLVPDAEEGPGEDTVQRPFANLRDWLKK